MLNSNKLSQWLTIFTNTSVLIGVIFLVIEIRQNNEFLEFEKFSRNISDLLDGSTILFRDESFTTALFEDPSTRTPAQDWRLKRSVSANFNSMQRAWSQGYFEQNPSIATFYHSAFHAEDPRGELLKSVWEEHKQLMIVGFVEWFEQNVVNET